MQAVGRPRRRLSPGARRLIVMVVVCASAAAVLTVLAVWERGWECVRTVLKIDAGEAGVNVIPACAEWSRRKVPTKSN